MRILEQIEKEFGKDAADTMLKRFWSNVDRCPIHWWWLGSGSLDSYGTIQIYGKTFRAHRLSWEIAHGTEFPSRVARHSCDIPACVNPEHVIPGTHRQNARDSVERRRDRWSGLERKRLKARLYRLDRILASEKPVEQLMVDSNRPSLNQ